MGKITIMPETVKDPISLIGRCAGVCWGSDVSDPEKNYKRGLECIKSDHGRTIEFPDIYSVIQGYSARVIREWYTHIGCLPSRLQSSTRRINYHDFEYVTPESIEKFGCKSLYDGVMHLIGSVCEALEVAGVPREDAALLLPLGMCTGIVDKRNLRNVMDMSRQRMCSKAYHEYRKMFRDYLDALRDYSDEWSVAVDLLMAPKCEKLGYCNEKESCGHRPRKEAASCGLASKQ